MIVNLSKWITASLLAVALLTSNPAHADSICTGIAGNLVANCGFENGSSAGPNSSTTPVGWTVTNPFTYEQVVNSASLVNSGSYAYRFGNFESQGAATIAQTIADIAGDDYTFSFFLLNEAGGESPNVQVQAFWDSTSGTPLLSLTNTAQPSSYTKYSFTVLGTGSDTITFSAYNDPAEFYLDDVSVVDAGPSVPPTPSAVPEPSSLALLVTGILGAAGTIRRRLVAWTVSFKPNREGHSAGVALSIASLV